MRMSENNNSNHKIYNLDVVRDHKGNEQINRKRGADGTIYYCLIDENGNKSWVDEIFLWVNKDYILNYGNKNGQYYAIKPESRFFVRYIEKLPNYGYDAVISVGTEENYQCDLLGNTRYAREHYAQNSDHVFGADYNELKTMVRRKYRLELPNLSDMIRYELQDKIVYITQTMNVFATKYHI